MLKYKLKEFDIRAVGKYSGIVKMKKGTSDAEYEKTEHLIELGTGVTYEKKIGRLDIRYSVDGRYIFGYGDKKTFSILNLWSDNKAEYKLNNKLTLKGELNLTTSNRLSILNHNSNEDELLLLADTKGIVEYKLNNKTDITSTIGAKTISLFSALTNNTSKKSSSNNMGGQENKLHLKLQYSYKIYTDNKVKYQLRDNIGIIGKFGMSYSTGIKLDKLYESLNKIKRNQVGEKGIEDFSKEDLDIIKKEENAFGNDIQSLLLISPEAEAELKYINNRLIIKPRFGIDVSAKIKSNENKMEYKAVNVKTGLKVEYRW
ncbi:hypothetical protein [Streptobacillus moniliformis]|uniref:hypothetical protein n=2 Tax=Streptobacillus moniliformis TaxID=34105 RepID=UPI0007E36410|nr:hypothetical protein [Streptobacillus moniliformis]